MASEHPKGYRTGGIASDAVPERQLPLSNRQERRLRVYLEESFLSVSRLVKKRSESGLALQGLSPFLNAMKSLMVLILSIPPVDPSASLRTSYLLRFTGELLEAIPSYPLAAPMTDSAAEVPTTIEETLILLLEIITLLDKGWKAILLSQAWDTVRGAGGESFVSTGGVTTTDKIRLASLLMSRKEALCDWLESGPVVWSSETKEEFANMFWRTLTELSDE